MFTDVSSAARMQNCLRVAAYQFPRATLPTQQPAEASTWGGPQAVEAWIGFDVNPLYLVLHESIYCQVHLSVPVCCVECELSFQGISKLVDMPKQNFEIHKKNEMVFQ